MQTITDQLTLVMLDITKWGAHKRVAPDDLNLKDRTPPKTLWSMGAKRVYDPAKLQPFDTLAKQAARACRTVGTDFLKGFAVPNASVRELETRLETLAEQYKRLLDRFIGDYHAGLDDWVAQFPEWEGFIRRSAEPVEIVRSRFKFDFDFFRIEAAASPKRIAERVSGLGDSIMNDVAQIAKEMDKSFKGKSTLNRRALATFRRIRDKLGALSFVDPRLVPIVDTIDDWIGRVPSTGAIEGALFNEGFGLSLLLSDPAKMAEHGAGQIAPSSQDDAGGDEEALAATPDLQPQAPSAEVGGSELDALADELFGDLGAEPDPAPDADAQIPPSGDEGTASSSMPLPGDAAPMPTFPDVGAMPPMPDPTSDAEQASLF